jgi:hypothetical protein
MSSTQEVPDRAYLRLALLGAIRLSDWPLSPKEELSIYGTVIGLAEDWQALLFSRLVDPSPEAESTFHRVPLRLVDEGLES